MRRQRKIHSLRRHYNETTAGKQRSESFGVHWAPEPRPPSSSTSSASRRNSSYRSSGAWYKSASTGVYRKPSKPATKSTKQVRTERRSSPGIESAKALTRQPTGLCPRCFDLALYHFESERTKRQHHRNFVDLINSAKTCVLCFIIAKQAPVPPPGANFSYDGTRHITLSITNRRSELDYGAQGLALDKLMVYLPTTRLSDQRALTLPAQAQLIAGRESQAATNGDVIGRRTYGGTNVQCAVNWLAECVMSHKECRKSTDLVGSLMYAVPPRLLDLGFNDSYSVRLIETDHNFSSPYVALTYTRGSARVSSTNETNLASRQQSIGIEKFNKTFKQAISISRMLGFRYLWIDAYCIVMDSPEDRTKHVPRMGIIFHNAALTLSAAVSPSADDGLVRYKAKTLSEEAKIPYRSKDGTPLGHFFVTADKPRDFVQDVTQGELNQRAWCLQARALSRRTLHFGNDQLFWECDAGVWSEASAIEVPQETISDPMMKWRANFLLFKRGVESPGRVSISTRVKTQPTAAMLVMPKIYQLWYSLVAQYTSRNLPRDKDKSSAIAGLAYIFACLISQRQGTTGPTKPRPDTYLCGLWQNDLPYGLVWSSGSFHKWRMKFAKYPSSPRAPSWSWMSVDGPLDWPDGVVFSSGSFTSRSFMKLLQVDTHYDKRTDHDFSTLRVRGKIALLSNLYGFRPEDMEWKRAVRDHDLAKYGGDHDKAEGPINMPCALFDSAEVARVWTTLHGSTERPSTGSSGTPSSAKSTGMFGRSSYRSGRSSWSAKPNLVHDQQKDFVALLVMPAGCTQENCKEHSFDTARLSATLPLPADTAFRAKNNCGQGLAYALILYPSSMGEGLFRRVGIAQVRIADFATVERRRDREVVIV